MDKYLFCQKSHRIISYLLLILIPLMIAFLIYKFHIILLVLLCIVALNLLLLCYWINIYKLMIADNKIIVYSFKKRCFEMVKIQFVSLESNNNIKFVYDDKVYCIYGFLPVMRLKSRKEKNKELFKIINSEIKKARYGKVDRCVIKDIKIIAEKRLWTLFIMLFYLFFASILIVSLIKEWSIVIFWIVVVILLIDLPILINKIISPRYILLYDSKDKKLIINKLFKSYVFSLDDIDSYYSNYRSMSIWIRLKDKKRIYLSGFKKISKVCDALDKLVKYRY